MTQLQKLLAITISCHWKKIIQQVLSPLVVIKYNSNEIYSGRKRLQLLLHSVALIMLQSGMAYWH